MTDRERSMPPGADWVDTTAGGQASYGEGIPETGPMHVPVRERGTDDAGLAGDDPAGVEQSDRGRAELGDAQGPGAGLGETRAGDAGGGIGVRSVQ